jgi:hypothetical protein
VFQPIVPGCQAIRIEQILHTLTGRAYLVAGHEIEGQRHVDFETTLDCVPVCIAAGEPVRSAQIPLDDEELPRRLLPGGGGVVVRGTDLYGDCRPWAKTDTADAIFVDGFSGRRQAVVQPVGLVAICSLPRSVCDIIEPRIRNRPGLYAIHGKSRSHRGRLRHGARGDQLVRNSKDPRKK